VIEYDAAATQKPKFNVFAIALQWMIPPSPYRDCSYFFKGAGCEVVWVDLARPNYTSASLAVRGAFLCSAERGIGESP
jgi:hypothetical protein